MKRIVKNRKAWDEGPISPIRKKRMKSTGKALTELQVAAVAIHDSECPAGKKCKTRCYTVLWVKTARAVLRALKEHRSGK